MRIAANCYTKVGQNNQSNFIRITVVYTNITLLALPGYKMKRASETLRFGSFECCKR